MINFISDNGEKISVLEFNLKRIKIQEARKFIIESIEQAIENKPVESMYF